MKHKIKLIDYAYGDTYGTAIEIDGEKLYIDGQYTYNCLDTILEKLGIDFEIEYDSIEEVTTTITKKMKLVEDN